MIEEQTELTAKQDEAGEESLLTRSAKCYAQYCYTIKNDSTQFYHMDFIAVLITLSERFLGEDTCHDLVQAFRRVEKIILFNKKP